MAFHSFLASLLLRNEEEEEEETSSSSGYLKQFDLRTFPILRKDVAPEEMFRPPSNQWWWWFPMFGTCNLWMGDSRSNKTGLHNDDEENVLCQVSGEKRVLLISPKERENVYVNKLFDSGTECCDVDVSSPDLLRHPLFAQVQQIYCVTLRAGDVLFIPKFWFHEVRPISTSISINYFSSTWIQKIWCGTSRFFWDFLHRLGLYKRGQCVCHDSSGASVKLDI
jgi:lysine-specific demethylase 8